MTVLLAYATHSGATRTLAEQIADTLADEGLAVELADVLTDPDPYAYAAAVIGSGIRPRISSVALFSCSGSTSVPAKRGSQNGAEAVVAYSGLAPVAVRNVPRWVFMDRFPCGSGSS